MILKKFQEDYGGQNLMYNFYSVHVKLCEKCKWHPTI